MGMDATCIACPCCAAVWEDLGDAPPLRSMLSRGQAGQTAASGAARVGPSNFLNGYYEKRNKAIGSDNSGRSTGRRPPGMTVDHVQHAQSNQYDEAATGKRAINSNRNADSSSGGELFPPCGCKKASVQRTTTKEGPNKGRVFYTCATKQCKFFQWCD